jgi:HSP20 family protein
MSHRSDDPYQIAQREIERLFRDLIYQRLPSSHFTGEPWAPPADVVVSEDSARVILELAGVPRETVRVRVQGRTLEISGRRNAPHELRGAHYHRAEIYFGEFRRVVELPWEAEESTIEALYRDGMLEILLKVPRPSVSQRIPVRPVREKNR